jgi:hypothetical protein
MSVSAIFDVHMCACNSELTRGSSARGSIRASCTSAPTHDLVREWVQSLEDRCCYLGRDH